MIIPNANLIGQEEQVIAVNIQIVLLPVLSQSVRRV
jgi:hypothetical protein